MLKEEGSTSSSAPLVLQSLPSATWVDECLLTARTRRTVVCIRFGFKGDAQCESVDRKLLDTLTELDLGSFLSVYTVDIEEVPEFTYMYELYDPFTIMLFHRSKPLVFDVGHGPTRKIVHLPSWGPPLTETMRRVVRETLELETPLESSLSAVAALNNLLTGSGGYFPASDGRVGNERPDESTWTEEAQRTARETAW